VLFEDFFNEHIFSRNSSDSLTGLARVVRRREEERERQVNKQAKKNSSVTVRQLGLRFRHVVTVQSGSIQSSLNQIRSHPATRRKLDKPVVP